MVNKSMLKEEFLTTGDVATYCEVTTNGVKKWISEGKLKAFQTPGKHFRITKRDFKDFLVSFHFPVDPRFFGLNKKKILIVDDEPKFIQFAVDVLGGIDNEFLIKSAENGYEALIKLGSFKPDLLILDIRMPKIDGIEVLKRIRKNSQRKDLKIMITTAFMEEKENVLREGADDFLLKPISVNLLQESVMTLLGNESSMESSAYSQDSYYNNM